MKQRDEKREDFSILSRKGKGISEKKKECRRKKKEINRFSSD